MDDLQLKMPDPSDWCSIGWAAWRIGCDERTVRRLIHDNRLRGFRPRVAPNESLQRKVMLHVAEVERFAVARRLVDRRSFRALAAEVAC